MSYLGLYVKTSSCYIVKLLLPSDGRFYKAKMHQIRFPLGHCHRPRWGGKGEWEEIAGKGVGRTTLRTPLSQIPGYLRHC